MECSAVSGSGAKMSGSKNSRTGPIRDFTSQANRTESRIMSVRVIIFMAVFSWKYLKISATDIEFGMVYDKLLINDFACGKI